jgi:hypothetical protein
MTTSLSGAEWSDRFIAAYATEPTIAARAGDIAQACERAPQLAESSPEACAANLTILAHHLKLALPLALDLAISTPALFYKKPEEVLPKGSADGVQLGAQSRRVLKYPYAPTRHPEELARFVADLAVYLDLPPATIRTLCYKFPGIAALDLVTLEQRVQDCALILQISEAQYLKILRRVPKLMIRKPQSIDGTVTGLCNILEHPRATITHSILRFPKLLLSKPEYTHQRVVALAHKLTIPKPDAARALLRVPSLFSMATDSMARKIRLGHRIARLYDPTINFTEVLRLCPSLPTYSKDSLLIRWLIARLRASTWTWNSLIQTSADNALSALRSYAINLPADSPEREKLARLVQRRMDRDLFAAREGTQ